MCSNDSRLHTIKPNLPGRLLESYAPLALPFQREYFGEPPSKFIGRLNRIVRCRQYESLADREPYREAMGAASGWQGYRRVVLEAAALAGMENQILTRFRSSRPMTGRASIGRPPSNNAEGRWHRRTTFHE
jgi:hypothetical protein